MANLDKENKILEAIKGAFKIEGHIARESRVMITADKDMVSSILLFCKNQQGYIHLNHMSVVDRIEDGKFEINYIIWSPTEKVTVMVKTFIDRENAEMENIDSIWDQANTYEREMREMYGIQFPGLIGREEFLLEDWDEMPPMRRDFDTNAYAAKTFYQRPGREDAKDVREELTKQSGEVIPEFAKKYSRE